MMPSVNDVPFILRLPRIVFSNIFLSMLDCCSISRVRTAISESTSRSNFDCCFRAHKFSLRKELNSSSTFLLWARCNDVSVDVLKLRQRMFFELILSGYNTPKAHCLSLDLSDDSVLDNLFVGLALSQCEARSLAVLNSLTPFHNMSLFKLPESLQSVAVIGKSFAIDGTLGYSSGLHELTLIGYMPNFDICCQFPRLQYIKLVIVVDLDFNELINAIVKSCAYLITLHAEYYFPKAPNCLLTINTSSRSLRNLTLLSLLPMPSKDQSVFEFCRSSPQLERVVYQVNGNDCLDRLHHLLLSAPQLRSFQCHSFTFDYSYDPALVTYHSMRNRHYDHLQPGEGPLLCMLDASDEQLNTVLDVLPPMSLQLTQCTVSERTIHRRIKRLSRLRCLRLLRCKSVGTETTWVGLSYACWGDANMLVRVPASSVTFADNEFLHSTSSGSDEAEGRRESVFVTVSGGQSTALLWNYLLQTSRPVHQLTVSYSLDHLQVNRFGKTLQRISFEGVDVTFAVVREIAFCCGNLLSFTASSCHTVMNDHIYTILTGCHRLKQLVVLSCQVTPQLLELIAKHGRGLEHIQLDIIPKATRQALEKMLCSCKMLRYCPLSEVGSKRYLELCSLLYSYGVDFSAC